MAGPRLGRGGGCLGAPPRGWAARTGTEYMVLRLLRNFSVASMNKLSMGVFWERRSFTWRGRERPADPALPGARHLGGHCSALSRSFPGSPGNHLGPPVNPALSGITYCGCRAAILASPARCWEHFPVVRTKTICRCYQVSPRGRLSPG